MSRYRFSVFTATYNRVKFLPVVYNSLIRQTYKNFEWIIIDDGSTDDTESLINEFIREDQLKIRYVKKENGGKHTAWREATKLFESEYVVSIDSDDSLTDDALEIFDRHWKVLENSEDYHMFWEVKARAKYLNGKMIEQPLPSKIFDMHPIEFSYKYNFFGDLHGCRKASVLRNEAKVPDNFLFEENCSNFSESIRWFRAGKKYKTRYVEEFTEIVNPNADNKLTGKHQSKNKKIIFNNLVHNKYQFEDNKREMIKWRKDIYLKTIIFLLYFSFQLNINTFKIIKELSFVDKIFLVLFYVPVYILEKIKK